MKKKKKTETTPYVNVWRGTPDDGFQQFFESPRYATGYTSLFNCLGYVVETHMLKDYKSRVKVTYDFMVSAMEITSKKAELIKEKQNADAPVAFYENKPVTKDTTTLSITAINKRFLRLFK